MFKLNSGTMFIAEADGDVVELGGISESIEFEEDVYKDITPININKEYSLTCSFNMTKEMVTRLYDVFLGLGNAICDLCPNKKVVHLYKHAKKHRIRKKNRARMVKILEKMR